jgi:Uma2 family endonuclease
MSQTACKFTLICAADYLAAENDGTWRHEFVNGAVYAMAGASDRHNLIRGNLAALLLGHTPEQCEVFSAEMKLRIKSNTDERYYYPDVFVVRDPNDCERYTRDHAVLVVEVLSPSTDRADRTEKFEESVGLSLSVSDLYRRVQFDEAGDRATAQPR